MTLHSNTDYSSPPVFHCLPQDKIVKSGDNVILECIINGHPNSWSIWDKNGSICIPSKRLIIKETTHIKSLEMKAASYEDAGLYRITIQNEYGRIEASMRLVVTTDSTCDMTKSGTINVKRRLMSTTKNTGERLVLAEQHSASSLVSSYFYLDGSNIFPTSRMCIVNEKQCTALVIECAEINDFGQYCCLMQYPNGSTIGSALHVNICRPTEQESTMTPPRIKCSLPVQVDVVEGTVVDLQLIIECNTPFAYIWLRDSQIVHDCDEFRFIDHGNGVLCLRIQDPFVKDSGIYTCIVNSTNGKCISECVVRIHEENSIQKAAVPQIINYPQSCSIPQGSNAIICAHVTPNNCEVEWKFFGKDVSEYPGITVTSRPDGIHILHINDVTLSHNGEIRSIARLPNNCSVKAMASTFLTVTPTVLINAYNENNTSAGPRFLNNLKDHTVSNGQNLTLEVFYCGEPEPFVLWMRAGRPIDDGNILITTMHGYSTLLIQAIDANQSGKYTVLILNSLGSDFMSMSVAVEGPPDPPSGQPTTIAGSDFVDVTWCGPPYDGGSMILGFILEMQCEEDSWMIVATVFDSLSYTVKHLMPNKIYRFRVRARNIHGYSEPSEPSGNIKLTISETSDVGFSKLNQHCKITNAEEFQKRYDILEELGRGRFGIVHKVYAKESHQIYAAKTIKCIKMNDKQKVRDEISMMRILQHPKLLQIIDHFESVRETVMILEYISGGELFERVVADDFTLTEKDCVMFIRQICEGVQYMHNSLIVHLDLKPENIMCSTRSSHQIKIIDFGLAQRLSYDTSVRVLLGTPEFVPPEIISYEPIGLQSDMWSIGVICYVLLSGLSPFMGDNDVETFNNITRAEYDFDDDAFEMVTEEAKDFISGLLQYRKEDRLTAAQCLETKWLSLDNVILGRSKICTHKLKKFIIRRKWQKTGNAIRALGRMALLSASRRNSILSTLGSVKSVK